MRIRTNLIILVYLTLPLPARADFVPVLSGPIARVVANAHHVAAVRGQEIWLWRDDGQLLGRLGQRASGTVPPNRRVSQQGAEEIFDVLGISELDRDTDWASDLLDDERTLAERRRARPGSSPLLAAREIAPLLAAAANALWITDTHGLVRVDATGNVIRERPQLAASRELVAGMNRLLVVQPEGLALLATARGEDRFVPLPTPPGKVALSASGQRWAWTSSLGIMWQGEDLPMASFAPPAAVLDLAYCGETLVALLPDSLLVIPPEGAPEKRNRDLRAHRFLCPDGRASPWLAAGQVLFMSFDQGRQWHSLATPPGLAIADVAATAHHLWLATDQGLYFSSDDPQPPVSLAPAATRHRARGRHRGAAWVTWLPKVSVRAAATVALAGHQFEALALAQFPLDPSQLPTTAAAFDAPGPADPESASPRRNQPTLELQDPDADCLVAARRKAVELALAEPERAQSYVTRAGRAAWLPELRVLVSRRYGRSESLDLGSSSTALSSPLGIDTVNDIRYEARATWDLGKLVFSPEELAAQNQALHMAELRRDIESTVNRLYFERRRLALESAGGDGAARHLRRSEIEAELDALSVGAFGACAAARSPGGR